MRGEERLVRLRCRTPRRARGNGRSRAGTRRPARGASGRAGRGPHRSAWSAEDRAVGQTCASSTVAAPAAASPSSRHDAACSGIPATMPSEAHSAAIVSSAQRTSRPAPAAQGVGCACRRAPGQREARGADEQQEREPDHAGVREHLDVEVLDAPFAILRREREVDDVGEARARVVDVRLEHLRARRALPADAEHRVVLRRSAGRCRRAPFAASTSRRRPAGRLRARRGSGGSPRARRRAPLSTPPATTATTRDERERLAAARARSGVARRSRGRPRRARDRRPPRPIRRGRGRGRPLRARRRRARSPGARAARARSRAAARARANGGERGEVVVAEEGRLPPAGVPRSEDVDAEELQERDGDRDGAPRARARRARS